jgi:hypothetical protein
MLYLSIVLFTAAAIAGIIILKNWLTSADTARSTVYLHGIAAAAALVVLLVYFLRNPGNDIRNALILFGIAALAGFYMFFRDLKGKFSPVWMAVVHGLVAAAGLIFLVLNVLG